MTGKQKIAFIKNKIVPLFDGMKLSDIRDIMAMINHDYELEQYLRVSVISSADQARK